MLLAELRALGFRNAVGGITLPNEASVALHEALGFVKTAHFPSFGYKHGGWHDVGFWQLKLADYTVDPPAPAYWGNRAVL